MSLACAASRAERSGDQAPRSGDFRSELIWDIAAMAPIRTINMYIFIISPGLGRPLTARRIDPLAISTPVVDER